MASGHKLRVIRIGDIDRPKKTEGAVEMFKGKCFWKAIGMLQI
jgi:hypothetical protein